MPTEAETTETNLDEAPPPPPIRYVHVGDDAGALELERDCMASEQAAIAAVQTAQRFGAAKQVNFTRMVGQWVRPDGGWICKLVDMFVASNGTQEARMPAGNGKRSA